jgi:phage FluMu protein Com
LNDICKIERLFEADNFKSQPHYMTQVRCNYCHKMLLEVSDDSSGRIELVCPRVRCRRFVVVQLPSRVSTFANRGDADRVRQSVRKNTVALTDHTR